MWTCASCKGQTENEHRICWHCRAIRAPTEKEIEIEKLASQSHGQCVKRTQLSNDEKILLVKIGLVGLLAILAFVAVIDYRTGGVIHLRLARFLYEVGLFS